MANLSHSPFYARRPCQSFTRFHRRHWERRFICHECACTPNIILSRIQWRIHHAGHYPSNCSKCNESVCTRVRVVHENFQGITFCLIILQVHFHIGGSSSTEQSSDVGGILTNLFRGRSTRDHHFSMQRVAVHITEEEIVQSDNMSGKNSQPVSGNVFQL